VGAIAPEKLFGLYFLQGGRLVRLGVVKVVISSRVVDVGVGLCVVYIAVKGHRFVVVFYAIV
jgi:hypothetical protein